MMDKNFFAVFTAVTCLKFLLIPMYRSTDFEVHRNWMAITYQRNLSTWYQEETSIWTLDYPPFFAWFEYALSHAARYFDEKMIEVENLNYASSQTVFFQRLSVILSDLMYIYGVSQLCRHLKKQYTTSDDPWINREVILSMLLLWNPGLLIIDHVHFQYNGFLNGMLFLSIACVMKDDFIQSAIWYTVLLNFKHIYLYLAPAYFVYFLKNYCFTMQTSGGSVILKSFSFRKFLSLGVVVIGIFWLSFGPFIMMGQFSQIMKKLFPVSRGLTHSYWAPNFWALYNFVDRVLTFIAYRWNFLPRNLVSQVGMTRGLVQEYHHIILPSISPLVSLIFTVFSILPALWMLWNKPKSSHLFIQSIVLCSFGSFIFGWHVHEKAILMIILPLTVMAVCYQEQAEIYTLLSVIGHFSLFPLLYEEAETPLKILLLLLHSVYAYTSLKRLYQSCHIRNLRCSMLSTKEIVFICGIPLLQAFSSFGLQSFKLGKRFPFLPLMLISTYCSLGVLYSWKNTYSYFRKFNEEFTKISPRS